VPYGIYDIVHNQGYVYVGTSSDTATFAVDAIGRWFERQDRPKFADESKILILCDAGGSNGYRVRNWKRELQRRFADLYGVEVMVCHYPSVSDAEMAELNLACHRICPQWNYVISPTP
jgi:Rhodopirellula transposase DDE domain